MNRYSGLFFLFTVLSIFCCSPEKKFNDEYNTLVKIYFDRDIEKMEKFNATIYIDNEITKNSVDSIRLKIAALTSLGKYEDALYIGERFKNLFEDEIEYYLVIGTLKEFNDKSGDAEYLRVLDLQGSESSDDHPFLLLFLKSVLGMPIESEYIDSLSAHYDYKIEDMIMTLESQSKNEIIRYNNPIFYIAPNQMLERPENIDSGELWWENVDER